MRAVPIETEIAYDCSLLISKSSVSHYFCFKFNSKFFQIIPSESHDIVASREIQLFGCLAGGLTDPRTVRIEDQIEKRFK